MVMARHKGDHEARRRDVSAAVWRVLASHGFGGLTLRAVATEMGATTGLLTHYFPSKKDLIEHALTLLDEHRMADRPTEFPDGLAGLRAMLLEILPLTEQAVTSNRIWVGSWDAALANPELAAGHAVRYRRSRERIRTQVVAAQQLGELPPSDPDDIATALLSFVLGLIVQTLLDQAAFPAGQQIRLLDQRLAELARTIQ